MVKFNKKNYRFWLQLIFCCALLGGNRLQAQVLEGPLLPDRIFPDSALAPFYHGVASGDPLPDAVVIWTRLSTTDAVDTVFWEFSLDTLFQQPVQSGYLLASEERDYTVKKDVQGLQPGTWYYYRFRNKYRYSLMGRTRTAPEPSLEIPARFAVMACSNYQDGFFNAYRDVAEKNDVDAVIHLGDYIYEYGTDDFSPGSDSSRLHDPATEIYSLSDYRMRHSFYKLDQDLREMHRQFPFISIWDDHETANDSWTGGAQNHSPATEGDWEARKNAGKKAYFEWMPLRERPGNASDTIRRSFQWGGLISLIMTDTRLEARQEQIGVSGPAVTDTNRTLLGKPQLNWLKSKLQQSGTKWKLIGNQIMISSLRILGTPVNQDQWDGYPAERDRLLRFISDNGISNVVFLTGDIHTSWANDVPLNLSSYVSSTGSGSVASEFVCSSVTSSSFVNFTVPLALIRAFNPNVKYADLSKKGYLLLDVSSTETQADWIYMSTIQNREFTRSVGASWRSLDEANKVTQASAALPPRANMPALAPMFAEVISNVPKIQISPLFHCTFEPEWNRLRIQVFRKSEHPLKIQVINAAGKEVFVQNENPGFAGMWQGSLPMVLPAGIYFVRVANGEGFAGKKLFIRP